MRLLIDTCTFLWLVDDHPNLSPSSRELCADPDHEILLSSVSAWEIAVKHSLGKMVLSESPRTYVPRYREMHGVVTMPLDEDSVLAISRLPLLHRDPFDRMLICQAITHGLTILTPDPLIAQYPVRTLW